jgi:hypothetical protein
MQDLKINVGLKDKHCFLAEQGFMQCGGGGISPSMNLTWGGGYPPINLSFLEIFLLVLKI